VLLAARRSAVQAATEPQLQAFSLVIAAPEPIRARFPGQKLPSMLATAANLRLCSSWDVETTTTTTVIALLSLARRFRALSIEAKERKGDQGHRSRVAPIPANSDKSSTAIGSTATATASSTGRCTRRPVTDPL
jgi:hypothetical protein